jgi:hypothetical protein
LKNNLNFLDAFWRILTEVPGWPDAPRKLRIRRLLPIIMPVAAMGLLVLWNLAWNHPRIQEERTAHQPLLALEQEVADLQLAGPDLRATAVEARAAEVGQILLPEPTQLTPVLETLKENARSRAWVATFHQITDSTTPPPSGAQVNFLAVRGKLAPAAGNTQPFPTLLACLEQFSLSAKWIDLTRLTLRADEQGRLTAEVNLRVGCRLSHEKTPE